MTAPRHLVLPLLALALMAPSCDGDRDLPADWRERAVREGFLLGANYWNRYGGDFGHNGWGDFGVAEDSRRVGRDLDAMRRAGVSVVRWPIFADGRSGIVWGEGGEPEGVQEGVYEDLDKAVEMLDKRRMCALFVLFDFTMMYRAERVDGVSIGGRAGAWRDARKRRALAEKVVAPVVGRLSRSDRILGWDIMNEPEWVVRGIPHAVPDPKAETISRLAFWDGAASMAAAVHAAGPQLVTIGSAAPRWARLWTDAYAEGEGLPPIGLDVYQVHYHPETEEAAGPEVGMSPLDQEAESLGLDRPVLVGEMPVRLAGDLRAVRWGGWAGALAWRWRSGDGYTDWDELARFSGGERPCG